MNDDIDDRLTALAAARASDDQERASIRDGALQLLDDLIENLDATTGALSTVREALILSNQSIDDLIGAPMTYPETGTIHETNYSPEDAPLPPLEVVNWPSDHMLEAAWGIIANASNGDWTTQNHAWRVAAIRWRDAYMKRLDAGMIDDAILEFNGHTNNRVGSFIGALTASVITMLVLGLALVATLKIGLWILGDMGQ